MEGDIESPIGVTYGESHPEFLMVPLKSCDGQKRHVENITDEKFVFVNGRHFTCSKSTACKIGHSYQVCGTCISANMILCRMPVKHPFGNFTIKVSNNGVDFSESAMSLEYRARPIIHGVVPSTGPSAGGSSRTVYGSNLPVVGAGKINCHFGVALVRAQVMTSTVIKRHRRI